MDKKCFIPKKSLGNGDSPLEVAFRITYREVIVVNGKNLALLLIILCVGGYVSLPTQIAYASSAEAGAEAYDNDTVHIQRKFEPEFYEKVQALKSNGTVRQLSLIIWITKVNNGRTRFSNTRIEELKDEAAYRISTMSNSRVYFRGSVLPVIIAKVPVAQVEKIATYEFVESIGDGEDVVHSALDVSAPAIRADVVRTNLGFNGQGIRIAVVDTGVDDHHPDLDDLDDNPGTNDPKVIDNQCFVDWDHDGVPDEGPGDDLGHGTHVAGIAAGTGQASNYQFIGVAPGAWIMNLKVLRLQWQGPDPVGSGENDDVVAGIDYAVNNGADIISLSLGGPGDELSDVSRAADEAVEAGVHVVVAAGNSGLGGSQTIEAPGNAFNVITVGAVDDIGTVGIADDTLAGFSSRGPAFGRVKPEVVAPGVGIVAPMDQAAALWQTYPPIRVGNFYARLDGTSMATPHVAGTVALMLQANPNLTPAQVKAILKQTARLNNDLNGRTVNDRGYGIIDAFVAAQLAQGVSGISRSYMYDSWNVQTPNRNFDPIGKSGDSLTFTVDAPSSTHGIGVSNVWYHFWDWWGATLLDYKLLYEYSGPHVWIDNAYYNLGSDMNIYLLSGPRIYEKGGGYVLMRAIYRVGGVNVEYLWQMGSDEIWLRLNFVGGSSWRALIYIDPDVWDSTNYAYLPSTSQTILYERRILGDVLLDIRDTDHTEYLQLDPVSTDNPRMWVLRHGYYGNNPESALNSEYIYNRDIVIYYQATSYIPDPGPSLVRHLNPLVIPNTNQNDAYSGGDAGNNLNHATSITPSYYDGILSLADPEDTRDCYRFNANTNESIRVSLTPPSGIDFDLELYDPAGNLKAASYNGPGCIDSISYTADSSGDWVARIFVHSGEARYSFSVSVGTPSGGGGCPILYVHDGKEYVSEGLLDIHDPDGVDVVLEHTLVTTPKRVDNEYLIQLIEHPQTISHIDHVQLFAILNDKTLLELPLVSAIHSKDGDVLSQLLFSDNLKTDALGANHNNGVSQSIALRFEALSPSIQAVGFVFLIEGNNMILKY